MARKAKKKSYGQRRPAGPETKGASRALPGLAGGSVEPPRAAAVRRPRDLAVQSAKRDALVAKGQVAEAVAPAQRAAALAPDDPEALLALGRIYLRLPMPVHAARAFRTYLEKFGEAAPIPLREVIAAAEEILPDAAREHDVDLSTFEEALYRMFDGWLALQLRDVEGAIAASDRALELVPRLVPALNNRASALLVAGRSEDAIAVSRRVVEEIEPDNAFALTTLVQALLFAGDREAASRYREPLRRHVGRGTAATPEAARGLAWLDDDEGVFQALSGRPDLGLLDARLLAVAATNLGKQREAISAWQAYLRHVPQDRQALDAIGELRAGNAVRRPYYGIQDIVPLKVLEEFGRLAVSGEKGERRAAPRLCRLMEEHPQITLGGELALRDPKVSQLGVIVLQTLATPAAEAALRRFVSGKEGSKEARMAAGQALVRMGAVSGRETVPFWDGGKWQQICFQVLDLVIEENPLPRKVASIYRRAIQLMQQGRAEAAVPLLLQLTREHPDVACFYNDLGAAYALLGREEEGVAARLRAIEVDPTYVMPRTSMAHRCLEQDDVEGARQWIAPLLDVTRMHPKHYAALMHVRGRLALADGEVDEARRIVDFIRDLGPTPEIVDHLEGLIASCRATRGASQRGRK